MFAPLGPSASAACHDPPIRTQVVLHVGKGADFKTVVEGADALLARRDVMAVVYDGPGRVGKARDLMGKKYDAWLIGAHTPPRHRAPHGIRPLRQVTTEPARATALRW